MSHFTSKEHFNKFKSAWAQSVKSPRAKFHLQSFDEWYGKSTYKGSTDKLEQVSSGNYWLSRGTGKTKIKGWIKPEHIILYNILTNKPLHTGFNPITNPKKMNEWESPMKTFYQAVTELEKISDNAKSLIADAKAMKKYRKEKGVISVIEKLNLFVKGFNDNMSLVDNKKFIEIVDKVRQCTKRPKDILSQGMREWREERVEEFLEPFEGTITLKMLGNIDSEQLKMIRLFDRQHKVNYWLKQF